MPDPFNSVNDLLNFTSFRQGAGGANDEGEALQTSAIEGTFAFSQFTNALQRARNEIYARCGQLGNDEYDDWREDQLTEAELWLATARLYPMYGEKIALKYPESNLSGVDAVTIGADTPSPVEKGKHWTEFMVARIRAMAEMLITGQGQNWDIETGDDLAFRTDPYPCLSPGFYSTARQGCYLWN